MDGIIVNNGTIVSVVFGGSGSTEQGQTFIATDVSGLVPGGTVSVTEIAAIKAYNTFIANGITVSSTATPALDGVYSVDDTSQASIATEAQFISAFSEFTNGGTVSLSWPMANGTLATFPNTASFMTFAKASAQTVAAARLAVLQETTVMPSSTVTIP